MRGLYFIGEVVDVTGHLGGFVPMGLGLRSCGGAGGLSWS